MTLGENKKITLGLIEEYSPTSQYLTDDEDIRGRINLVYFPNYQYLSEKKPIVKTEEIIIEETEAGRLEHDIPEDCRQIHRIVGLDANNEEIQAVYQTIAKKIYLKKAEGRYIIEYYAYPSRIDESTPDSFELEIDQDAEAILAYMVANDILKADPSADYTSFLGEFQRRMEDFDTRNSLPHAIVEEA